jgi:hypothetical protein
MHETQEKHIDADDIPPTALSKLTVTSKHPAREKIVRDYSVLPRLRTRSTVGAAMLTAMGVFFEQELCRGLDALARLSEAT